MADSEFLTAPKPLPNLNIPPSKHTVSVSVIDTGARVDLPISHFLEPAIKGKSRLTGPAYSFLITRTDPSTKKPTHLLFDLSIRKDYTTGSPPALAARLTDNSRDWSIDVPNDVRDVLTAHPRGAHGVHVEKLEEIEAIIWSHWHWDHTGDPSLFPGSTKLVVGPGFKKEFGAGWPDKGEDCPVKGADWAGRELKEVAFEDGALKIGRFRAVDWWGDGSFYLLDTPGHAVGHMCGLARVGEGAFVFLGGDCAHHPAEFRPSPHLPLPKHISPSPLPNHHLHHSVCPGALFAAIHPDPKDQAKPFYTPTPNFPYNFDECVWSVEGMQEFDAADNVLVVNAHDDNLLRFFDGEGWFWPKRSLDGWREDGLAKRSRWRFLGDFEEAAKEKEEGKV